MTDKEKLEKVFKEMEKAWRDIICYFFARHGGNKILITI